MEHSQGLHFHGVTRQVTSMAQEVFLRQGFKGKILAPLACVTRKVTMFYNTVLQSGDLHMPEMILQFKNIQENHRDKCSDVHFASCNISHATFEAKRVSFPLKMGAGCCCQQLSP